MGMLNLLSAKLSVGWIVGLSVGGALLLAFIITFLALMFQ